MEDVIAHNSRRDRRLFNPSSNFLAVLITLPLMYESWSRSKGQKSRSQGHATYQQQERNNVAVDGHINFKLGTVGKIKRK